MATFTTKSAMYGTQLAQKTPPKVNVMRGPTVVRASAGEESSRRAFLSSVAAGVAALSLTPVAEAIEVFDARKVYTGTGYDLIDEARDLSLPQSTRDGIDQFRGDISGTKARLTESIARLKKDVPANIEKEYWTKAREELRNQLGTMRFDLDTIASSIGDKQSRKQAKKAGDNFFIIVEELDDALRSKNKATATEAFEKVLGALGNVYLG